MRKQKNLRLKGGKQNEDLNIFTDYIPVGA